jgi:hypothetical protein
MMSGGFHLLLCQCPQALAEVAGSPMDLVSDKQQLASILGMSMLLSVKEGEEEEGGSSGIASPEGSTTHLPGRAQAQAVLAARAPIMEGIVTSQQLDCRMTACALQICLNMLTLAHDGPTDTAGCRFR